MQELPKIEIEKQLVMLESIAMSYPASSEQARTVELAAKALIFAWERQVQQEFQHFLNNFDCELSGAEKEHLRKLGIIESVTEREVEG